MLYQLSYTREASSVAVPQARPRAEKPKEGCPRGLPKLLPESHGRLRRALAFAVIEGGIPCVIPSDRCWCPDAPAVIRALLL